MTLQELQQQLTKQNIEAILVTKKNMYLNQDVKPEENNILALSGFSGSQGYMLVTPKKAWLLVDSRYSIQARLETNPELIEVVDVKSFCPTIYQILKEQNISSLACNPWCISIYDWDFFKIKGIEITEEENLIKNIVSRSGRIFEHELKYCGKTSEEKCREVAEALPERFAAMLITSAEEVSWIANLRSNDLEHTPVVRAYALLSKNKELKLFADNCNHKNIYPLSELSSELEKYNRQTIFIERNFTPQKLLSFIPDEVGINLRGENPITEFKVTKNQTEIDGFKNSHIRDGVAIAKFLYWLETNYCGKTEFDIVRKLKEFRAQNELFFSDSFSTIAASGANAAIVHYSPTEKNCSAIKENSVLLLDSGAQYFDGTTDVTRTIAIGTPSDEIKDAFTQVLKSHIALASLTFPKNTSAAALDSICRAPLWRFAKDYGHGTGHSVSHFSDVHESPFGISQNCNKKAKENYITSIEPGFYKENEYGIRIENMVYIRKCQNTDFLEFKNLTLVPIDKRLINTYLLSSEEQNWLNNYHKEVINCLAPYLDEEEKNWLKDVCSSL